MESPRSKVAVMRAPEAEDHSITLELISPTLAQIRDELHMSWFFIEMCYTPRWIKYLQFKLLERRVRLKQKASA